MIKEKLMVNLSFPLAVANINGGEGGGGGGEKPGCQKRAQAISNDSGCILNLIMLFNKKME